MMLKREHCFLSQAAIKRINLITTVALVLSSGVITRNRRFRGHLSTSVKYASRTQPTLRSSANRTQCDVAIHFHLPYFMACLCRRHPRLPHHLRWFAMTSRGMSVNQNKKRMPSAQPLLFFQQVGNHVIRVK